MSGTDVSVEAVAYEVTACPADVPDRDMWVLRVERRGPDSWAVLHRSFCWNRSTRDWDHEPNPSNRTDAFKRTHRFPLDQALNIARRQAPLVTIMGKTAADVTAWAREIGA